MMNMMRLQEHQQSNYFAIAEKMLEECGLDDEHEKLIRALVIDEEINDRTNSIFIELVGNIVTQSEQEIDVKCSRKKNRTVYSRLER